MNGNGKDAYYFSHDSNARNDPQMLLLRAKHGPTGYAVFFMTIEILREQADYRLRASDLLYPGLALGLGHPEPKVRAIVKDCLTLGLLKQEKDCLFSESLLRRMGALDELRKARSVAGRAGAEARYKQSHGKRIASPEQSHSKRMALDKGDEAEQKKERTEGRASRGFTPPTLAEVKAYCEERRNNVDPERFLNHYTANGWVRGKTKIKDWRACIRTWEAEAGFKPPEDKQRAIKKCAQCVTRVALPGSLFCADCAFCVDCDSAGKNPRSSPASQLVMGPKDYPVCPDCLAAAKKD